MPSCRRRRKWHATLLGGSSGTVFGHFKPLRASQRLMQEQLQPWERIPPPRPGRQGVGIVVAVRAIRPLAFALTHNGPRVGIEETRYQGIRWKRLLVQVRVLCTERGCCYVRVELSPTRPAAT